MPHPVTVLFGTTTGNAEDCAGRAARHLQAQGLSPRLQNMRDAAAALAALAGPDACLLVVSTWGDGEPPDDAVPFWEGVVKLAPGALAGLRYAVLALGDSAYEKFCGFGRDCDAALERLGAVRIAPCAECDVDVDEALEAWLEQVAPALRLPPGRGAVPA